MEKNVCRTAVKAGFLCFAVLGAAFLLPLLGRTLLPPRIWLDWIWGNSDSPAVFILKERFWNTLLALTAGGGLATAGLLLQTLFRNPLASPFTLGIAGGASFGAVLTISAGVWFLKNAGGLSGGSVMFGALAGAVLAVAVVFLLGKNRSAETVLLAGVGVNFFFSGMILFLQYTAEEGRLFRMVRWTMGEISLAEPVRLVPVLGVVFAAGVLLSFFSRGLDLLLTGEERALSLGMNVKRFRLFLFFVSSALVGAIVSLCGPIGFVGLTAPHFARLWVGPNHAALLPVSALFGALFLAVCFTAARILFYPDILPVGVLTSLLGGPFFVWLLMRRRTY